jgi:hypothetical protein
MTASRRYLLWLCQRICINVNILLGQLFYSEIHGVNIQWFESHLAGRKQNVHIVSQKQQQKFSSHWWTIKCGVHLVSILGTLLFIIYINNIHHGINTDSRPVLFADDTSVLITANDLNELQTKSTSKLNYMSKWFAVNALSWNIQKTNALHFKSNHLQNDSFKISYQGKEIKEVTNIKISWTGAWKTYGTDDSYWASNTKKRSACYRIRSMYSFSDMTTLKRIYFAHFHSIMQYGIILWGNFYIVGKFISYKRKSEELWQCLSLELHVSFYSEH